MKYQSASVLVLTVVALSVVSCWPAAKLPAKNKASAGSIDSRSTARSRETSTYSSISKKVSIVMHPAFKDAGKKAGLQIWRIENFEPVPFPEKEYGKFYSGDSFIVMNTKERNGSFSWDIHFWLGNETSQDEAGSAAILAVELDDSLGGVPVQYRETQGHESDLFLSYFSHGIRYLPGGVKTGFNHTEINPSGEKKLYQVKGKRQIRVVMVPPNIRSMNNGDCFILDKGDNIYVYIGNKSQKTERIRANNAANQIRDQDHNGRSHVVIIDQTNSAEELEKFFAELGSGSAKEVSEASEDDAEFEAKQDTAVALYKVSDASGKLALDKVEGKPLKKSALKSDDCFILDTTSSGIYVWVGKKGTTQEKVESLKMAQSFLATKNYPAWTRVARVVEGAEPAAFKQYFSDWQDGVGIFG